MAISGLFALALLSAVQLQAAGVGGHAWFPLLGSTG